MRTPKHEETIRTLEREGWKFCRESLCSGYRSAGSITPMENHGGYEYVRVHHGKVNFKGFHGYQITSVLRREL